MIMWCFAITCEQSGDISDVDDMVEMLGDIECDGAEDVNMVNMVWLCPRTLAYHQSSAWELHLTLTSSPRFKYLW